MAICAGNGATVFFDETCQRLPDQKRDYVVRADSGFFGDSFLIAIEQAGYAPEAKLGTDAPAMVAVL